MVGTAEQLEVLEPEVDLVDLSEPIEDSPPDIIAEVERPEEEQLVYRHKLEDGRVVEATSLAMAIKCGCTALAALAEKNPILAERVFNRALVGKTILAERAKPDDQSTKSKVEAPTKKTDINNRKDEHPKNKQPETKLSTTEKLKAKEEPVTRDADELTIVNLAPALLPKPITSEKPEKDKSPETKPALANQEQEVEVQITRSIREPDVLYEVTETIPVFTKAVEKTTDSTQISAAREFQFSEAIPVINDTLVTEIITAVDTPTTQNTHGEKLDAAAVLPSNIDIQLTPLFGQSPADTGTMFGEITRNLAFERGETETETESVEFDQETIETFDELIVLLSEQSVQAEPTTTEDVDIGQFLEQDLTIASMSENELEAAIDQLISELRDEQPTDTVETAEPAAITVEDHPIMPVSVEYSQPDKHQNIEVSVTKNSFQEFLAEEKDFDEVEPVSIEAIVEQAEDQPVEDTLLQLIASLPEAIAIVSDDSETVLSSAIDDPEKTIEDGGIEATDTVDNTITYEVLTALSELEAAIAASKAIEQDEDIDVDPDLNQNLLSITKQVVEAAEIEPELELTPLVTEKILELLQVLGYDNPQEALLEMAETRGVRFTLQAFQHVAQQANKLATRDDYREIMTFANPSSASPVTNQTHIRFGQALIWLVHKFSHEQQTTVQLAAI